MHREIKPEPAEPPAPRRAFYFNAGFMRQKRVRRIMELAGYPLELGKPGPDDVIAVWGHSPYAKRGETVAQATGASLVRVEDAFLRSLRPGRSGELPLGLVIDQTGVHFDGDRPSDLETLLVSHPLDDTALLDRARSCIERLKEADLTKYTGFDPSAPVPDPGYVLVIDQTEGDASVTHGGANAASFQEMLYWAQDENPGAPILIKTHPETVEGHRAGYFSQADETDRIRLFADPVSPWKLLEGAVAVYTVSSQLGFEAILADHKPRVFGRPFYAGWELTDDRHPLAFPRRRRRLTRAQLFAAACILYPKWYNPHTDALCELEDAIAILEAQTRAWREDHQGWDAYGMRLWKRKPLRSFFGQHGPIRFLEGPAKSDRRSMVWASQQDAAPKTAVRVEDGFLRSRGLGADLIPPLSLVCDDLGIYYDPARQSRLEALITARATLRPDQERRAENLITRLTQADLSKYNLGQRAPDLPYGHRILVPGQVEDDASIMLGAGTVASNLELLELTRRENPDAIILYKPHPDVEAGLRAGKVPEDALMALADQVLTQADPAALLREVDAVWTMTSLMGFEALLRGVSVTTTGAPFYAGWGLTRDIGRVPARRSTRPSLEGLVHAALIDYPRYYDPITRLPCPVETVIERLASGPLPRPGPANRVLAKLQGAFASYASLWR